MGERDAAVPPPHGSPLRIPRAREPECLGPPSPRGDLPGLDDQVELMRGWPRRTALMVGEPTTPTVLAVLHRRGFTTVVTSLARAGQDAAALGPFTFLLLTAEALGDDEAVARIRGLQVLSPSAKVLLQRPPGTLDPEVLIRALRAGAVEVIDLVDGALERTVEDGLREAGQLRERVLAIGAHPDDVELGCAGTLLDHRLRGDRVSILTLSRGAVGGDPGARVQEAIDSAGTIGAQLLFTDLPDSRIDDGAMTIRLIESVVRALDPTVVYVHSRNDSHQDHRAAAAASVSATRGVRRVFAFQSPSATNDYRPTQFVPIDAVVQRKVQALGVFRSQDGRPYLDPELIVSGSRYWARHLAANARYAEPFEVIRSVGDLRQNIGIPVPVPGSLLGFAVPVFTGDPASAGDPAVGADPADLLSDRAP